MVAVCVLFPLRTKTRPLRICPVLVCANRRAVWDAQQPNIDQQRFQEVQHKLRIQARDAEWWRDACLLYFQTFSKRPIPQDVEHPVHNLDEMMRFRIPISMYENPESGYNK